MTSTSGHGSAAADGAVSTPPAATPDPTAAAATALFQTRLIFIR
jgi:hypothetical protein